MAHHYSKHDGIIRKVALSQGVPFSVARQILNDYIDEVLQYIDTGEKVTIPRLGTFKKIDGELKFIPSNYLLKGMKKNDD